MAKDTKQKISEVAMKQFALKGFDGCSVDLIAAQAGVNKATIYYHFGDKASLYEEVLEENLGRFLARVEEAVGREETPEAKLEAFAGSYAANFSRNRAMAPLMLRELAADGAHLTGGTRALLRAIIQVVDDILAEGVRTGVFRKTATFLSYFMIVGSMNIYTSTAGMRKHFQGDGDAFGFAISPEDAAKEIATIVTGGLKK